MSICGWWTFKQDYAGTVRLRPASCKQWSCPDCAPRLKKRLAHRLKDTRVDRLVTLTCRPADYPSRVQAWAHLSVSVNRLAKRLKRQFPALKLEYLVVWEATRAGWPHAHLLTRGGFIPQRALSRHWRELTGAPVVDILRVTNQRGAVHYLAKYLTKGGFVPYPIRRYRTSKAFWDSPGGMFPKSPPDGPAWELIKEPCYLLAAPYQAVAYYQRLAPGGGWDFVPRGPPDHELASAAGPWERRAPSP